MELVDHGMNHTAKDTIWQTIPRTVKGTAYVETKSRASITHSLCDVERSEARDYSFRWITLQLRFTYLA